MTNENETPTIGIKAWGTTKPKQRQQFDKEEIPRLGYMKFQPGEMAELRVLTGFGTYYQARVKLPQSRSPFGDRVATAWPTYDDCPVKNDLGLEPKERFKVIAIDRKTNELKIVDLNGLTQEQLESHLETKNKRRADGDKVTPRDFDISVKFDPKSSTPVGFYTISTFDNEPLSEEDFALISDVGGEEMLDKILNRALLCPKSEWVRETLKKKGWDGKPVTEDSEAKTEEAHKAPVDDDYSFQAPADDAEPEVAAASNE